ncbi:MAG: Lipoprotein-releasing system ATP-binding protein LolD [Chlamydiales bacterium]|nr:Lipoprotein-releasing system ATP-binding protein LolD [Chlamydiales bacterium]
MEPILSAKKIRKTFTHPVSVEVLKGVSIEVFPGKSIAIMGASGEGKSTLLQILGTLEAPTEGELIIAGKSITHHPPPTLRNQHIGFVFQGYNLLEDYSVLQNVLMPALIAGRPIHRGSSIYTHACSLLDRVGLSHRIHFTTKLLSGGEKQRVALARALCNDPELLLADEPSGNLDHETSSRIHELLFHSVKELNKSLIVVTHDHTLAELCDRKLILCDGQLQREK